MSAFLDQLLTREQRAEAEKHDAALTHYEGQAALAELRRLQGVGLKPQPGCKLAKMILGDATVMVEYEYSPGRPGVHTLRNGDPGYPDEPAELALLNVLINGCMCDVQDVIPQAVIDDSDFDIWAEARPLLIEAFGAKLDAAVFFGTDKPAACMCAFSATPVAGAKISLTV